MIFQWTWPEFLWRPSFLRKLQYFTHLKSSAIWGWFPTMIPGFGRGRYNPGIFPWKTHQQSPAGRVFTGSVISVVGRGPVQHCGSVPGLAPSWIIGAIYVYTTYSIIVMYIWCWVMLNIYIYHNVIYMIVKLSLYIYDINILHKCINKVKRRLITWLSR